MSNLAHQQPYQANRIDFMRTFRNIDQAIEKYNEPKELRDQLRTGHRSLMIEVVKAYAAQVNANGYHDTNGKLRPLHATNALFAARLNCSTRTVNRYMHRLKAAGMVTRVNTHARGYTLHINATILHQGLTAAEKLEQAEPVTVANLVRAQLDKGGMTTCQQKETRNNSNKLTSNVERQNNLSGSIKKPVTLNKIHKRQGSNYAEKHKRQGKAAEPVNMPAAADLSRVIALVTQLWAWIEGNIYHRLDYLSDTQRAKGMALIAAMILQEPKSKQMRKRLEIRARLQMVADWLARDPGRYVPVPDKYFDPDNRQGFAATQKWYLQSVTTQYQLQQYKERYQEKARAYRAFTNVVEQWQRDPHNIDKYRNLLHKASNYHPALGKAFNSFITSTLEKNPTHAESTC